MQNFPVSRVLMLCALLSLQACSGSKHSNKDKKLPGDWQQTPIVVDGDSKEWPSPYPNYDSKAMVAYATSNDRDNLYITVETGDDYTQMKILKAGLTVWIDTSGGKEQSMAINYPLPDDNEPYNPDAKDGQSSSGSYSSSYSSTASESSQLRSAACDNKIRRALEDASQLTLTGFPNCNGGFAIAQTNACGIKVRIALDEYKELIWEASIPFKTLYGKDQITKADMGKPISVCFAVKAFKKESSTHGNDVSNSAGGMGSGGHMGGGGMGGGGGRGGGRHGNMGSQDNPKDHLYESTKTWKQFGLAFQ
jgi:hypothetical protein